MPSPDLTASVQPERRTLSRGLQSFRSMPPNVLRAAHRLPQRLREIEMAARLLPGHPPYVAALAELRETATEVLDMPAYPLDVMTSLAQYLDRDFRRSFDRSPDVELLQ